MVAGTACQRETRIVEWRRYRKGENQVECCSFCGREMGLRTGTWNLSELRTGGCMEVVW